MKALGLDELERWVESIGEPAYRGRQLFRWLHGRGVYSFEEMTDLPSALRSKLKELADISGIHLERIQRAADRTAKALFSLSTGKQVETVLIPDLDAEGKPNRLTVCVSSQVGCAMRCAFCATGLMGFQQDLHAGEIVDQVRFMDGYAREHFGRGITNVVYMGMGEPLLNYRNVLRSIDILTHPAVLDLSPNRITVSTVGLAARIRDLANDLAPFKLAVSLHAPTEAKRSRIMPVNRSTRTDLRALKDALIYYHERVRRPVTYEYCLFSGENDSEKDAAALAAVSRWVPSKVNLIMYNPVEGLPFRRSAEATVHRFIRRLVAENVTVTVRQSRGQDIDAACGQLAGRTAAGS